MQQLALVAVGAVLVAMIAWIFMNRNFWLWLAYASLVLVVAWLHLIISGFRSEGGAPKFGASVLIVLGLFLGFVWWNTFDGFQESDIVKVRQSIQDDLEKQPGVKVIAVSMTRKSDFELSGFARIESDGAQLTKTCRAVLTGMETNYLWTCD